ncbi:TetR family transcriptional regulator [Frondihabitans sp. PAMC 28766]|uniref:TetR/AcrR family transcriptional regulator n=1 Tax=Frondihabitans sp. PAMC 28766 TaxID=1795630 RepID=UPI00078BE920|nr:TetR/AcrR family transcriptional regulator [Frondihabitans sp. PAMC 28766]AMM20756.1 TetR family transcriptional regulator [Frondihabitans sp. PAMC 28766]
MPGTTRDARRAETSQKILHAAQQEFAQHGFDGATIRGIAERAGVHASLVMQHFGSKAQLFANAAQLPADDSAAASDHLADVLSMRLGDLPPETRALVRSMFTVPEAAASMRAFLDERVENLEKSFEGDDADVRATLAVSSILGLTIARHFLKLDAFDRIDIDALVEAANELLSRGTKG